MAQSKHNGEVVVKCASCSGAADPAQPNLCPVTGDAVGVVAATTLASGVEFVEALTIVLAMGTTRGWRSTWAGVGAALAALAVITALAGYALQSWLPEALLQLVVGTLLLIFGLQWLRKAILRAAGLKALHDEDDAFRAEVAGRAGARATSAGWGSTGSPSSSASRASSSRASRSSSSSSPSASTPTRSRSPSLGAAIGGAIVLAAGFALHKPLARVPENTIKFAVGLLLTTFGTFWAVEGLGWFAPDDASLQLAGRRPGPARCCSPCGARWRWRTVRLLAPRAAGGRVGALRDAASRASGGTSSSATTGASPPAWSWSSPPAPLLVARHGAPDGLVAAVTALGIVVVAIGSIAASACGPRR